MRNKTAYLGSIIFTLVSVVFLGYLATVLGDIRFNDTQDYHAVFANVSELRSGDQVRISGVEVGKVSSVSIVHGSQAEVTFNLDSGVQLLTNTEAVVRYKDLIGNRYLELQQSAQPASVLKPGGTLPLSQTSGALNLDSLFESFKPLLTGLQPNQINEVSQDLIAVLQGQAGSAYQLLSAIGSFSSTIADNDALVGDTITKLADALSSIDQHSTALSDVFLQLQQLVSGLNYDKAPLLNSLDQIQNVSGQAAALLAQIRAPLKVDVAQVGSLSDGLVQQAAALQTLLDNTPAAQEQATRLGSHGAFFNFFLCSLTLRVGTDTDNGVDLPTEYSDAARCKG